MSISVIVTVYNLQEYIGMCIDSLVNQTKKELEIILVDDGSLDDSGKICDDYAEKDFRIKVVHKKNGGLVSARKTGLSNASCFYVVYVDGDDWLEPDALEMMYKRIVFEGADLVKYGHYENTEDSQRLILNSISPGVYENEKLKEEIFPNLIAGREFYKWQVFPSLCDMIIKKSLLEKEQYLVDESLTIGEDAACMYPCMLTANRVSFVNEAYYHYRQISSSMIKSLPNKDEIRMRYARLNSNVTNRIHALKNVYDVTNQWMDHMLFSMIPRAGLLYDGIDELDYIFPFRNIKKGSRIALYCAGTYGQLLYRDLQENDRCDVVVWVDRNYVELSKQGLPVVSPERIAEFQVDGIIVASMFAKDREEIVKYLEGLQLNVEIGVIEPDFVRSDEVKRGFRLI